MKPLIRINWPNKTFTEAYEGDDWFVNAKEANITIPTFRYPHKFFLFTKFPFFWMLFSKCHPKNPSPSKSRHREIALPDTDVTL